MTISNSAISQQNKQQLLQTLILKTLEDLKADDITTFQLSAHSDIAAVAIICNGRSNRHVKSLVSNLATAIKVSRLAKVKIESDTQGEWALLDAGNIVVHAMQPKVREYYDLDAFIRESHEC